VLADELGGLVQASGGACGHIHSIGKKS
jgi:hypothetical protein